MRRRLSAYLSLALLGLATPVAGQTPLSLTDAIARAQARNPDAGSSAALEREAARRSTQAQAGYWPKIDLIESWQRGNQPVFVFGSRLAQRQFTSADFSIDALNRPDALDNFRTAVTIEQPLFDLGTRANVTAARLDRQVAAATRLMVGHELAVSVTTAYGRVLTAIGARRSAEAAVTTALADRELARNRRDAGLATDADVLQVDVYVARAHEQRIQAAADERIARAHLNQVMGEPLGEAFVLAPAEAVAVTDVTDVAALEAMALEHRPEPMALTAAAVIVGAGVILFDPIFQGLAISLMAGEVASLLLSRMAVPVLYYMAARHEHTARTALASRLVVPS